MSIDSGVEVDSIQRRAVGTLSTGQAFSGIAVAGAIPAGALIVVAVGGSEVMAGFAQTAGVVGAAVLALPLARIALEHGRRPALAVGYGLGAIGAVLVIAGAIIEFLPVILLGTFFVGVASAAGYQSRYAATDLARPDSVARSLSYVVWAATIGAVLGPNLLNASDRLGRALGLPRLTGPYLVAAACLFITTAVTFVFLRPDPFRVALTLRRGDAGASRPRLRDGLAHLRTRPGAIFGIAVISVGHIVMVMVMVMTPVHMAHVEVSLQLIGLVISVHVAGMYALSPLVGWAVDRTGRLTVVWAGIVILVAAAAIAGTAAADSTVQLGVGLFLLGLGWSCTLIAGSAIVTESTDADQRPAVQGLSDLSMNVAGAVGGIVAGLVVAFGSYAWLCAAAVVPLVALGIAAVRRVAIDSNTRSI